MQQFVFFLCVEMSRFLLFVLLVLGITAFIDAIGGQWTRFHLGRRSVSTQNSTCRLATHLHIGECNDDERCVHCFLCGKDYKRIYDCCCNATEYRQEAKICADFCRQLLGSVNDVRNIIDLYKFGL